VWEEITIPSYETQARYGARDGEATPRFLDAKLFNVMVLMPYHKAQFEAHTGLSCSSFSGTGCRQKSSVHF
jgi:hypothetical protein